MHRPMDWAKQAIDVGLITNTLGEHQALFADLGLAYDHLLKVGGGIHQHRYECGQSVVKLNSHRSALTPDTTGYVCLRIATDTARVVEATSPDGVRIIAVPHGNDGVVGVEVTWRTGDVGEAKRFLCDGLGASESEGRFVIGESLIVVEPDASHPRTSQRNHLGFRYLTVQVRDVEREHARVLDLGFEEGSAPVKLGETAYISFVRDHDGNWVELSQRASLTGPLPDLSSRPSREEADGTL